MLQTTLYSVTANFDPKLEPGAEFAPWVALHCSSRQQTVFTALINVFIVGGLTAVDVRWQIVTGPLLLPNAAISVHYADTLINPLFSVYCIDNVLLNALKVSFFLFSICNLHPFRKRVKAFSRCNRNRWWFYPPPPARCGHELLVSPCKRLEGPQTKHRPSQEAASFSSSTSFINRTGKCKRCGAL